MYWKEASGAWEIGFEYTAQLIDTATSAHIWAERLDRDVADLFAMQDEVTERIVSTIANRVEKVEQQRASRKGPGDNAGL